MKVSSNGVNVIIKKITLIGCSMVLVLASNAQHLSALPATQNFGVTIGKSAPAQNSFSLFAGPSSVRSNFNELLVSSRGDCNGNYGGPPLSVAFSSNRDSNDEIYVMDPDGMSQVNVTEHPASDLTPDISPNGRFVAFSSNRMTAENPEGDYEIFVMELRKPVSVWQVTSNTGLDSWSCWSPDGETIVFETRETSAATSWEIYRYTLG